MDAAIARARAVAAVSEVSLIVSMDCFSFRISRTGATHCHKVNESVMTLT